MDPWQGRADPPGDALDSLPVGVSWPWLPFTVAWALTAWLPLGVWATSPPAQGYRPLPQVDSLLDDVPGAALCAVAYLWPWGATLRARGTLALGLLRAMGAAFVVAITAGILALHPQEHWPPGGSAACQEIFLLGGDLDERLWCEAQAVRDVLTALGLGGLGLAFIGLAFVSARWIPAWLGEPFPSRSSLSRRQDPHVLAALALGMVALLTPLGAWAEQGSWPWATTLVWFASSSLAVVFASWVAGQELGREPVRSIALGVSWLAHLAPISVGLVFDRPRQPGELFFWGMVGAWVVGLCWQGTQLATPDPGYDGWEDVSG